MRRALAALLMVSMTGCGGEVVDEAAAQAAKDCKRTYNALEKGYRELLHQAQIGEFTFPTKEKWTTDCVAASLDKAALRCLDPNFMDGDDCKSLENPKVKELAKPFLSEVEAAIKRAKGGEAAPKADEAGKTEG